MRRSSVCRCLLLSVSLVSPFGGRVAHATGVPIEAIPVISRNAVTTLSPSHADTYQGFSLDHGYHFSYVGAGIVLNLGGSAYTELDATVYALDPTVGSSILNFQDVSNPTNGLRQIASVSIDAGGQRQIKVNVRGVSRLSNVLSEGAQDDTDLVGVLIGSPRYVAASYPSPNTVVPTNTSVVFLWHGFPQTTAYLLHIWLVKQSGTTAIGPTTRVFLSQLIFGHTSYTWDDKGFLPGAYQYDLLPLDRYGNALAGRSPAIQFTVAQGS